MFNYFHHISCSQPFFWKHYQNILVRSQQIVTGAHGAHLVQLTK